MRRSDKQAPTALSGILIVDKPSGQTSMDVVAAIRRRAGGTRTGHAGTLDPLATGVLVCALGRATKIIDRLMDTPKTYETEIDLSGFSATDDLEVEAMPVEVQHPPPMEEVERALEGCRGTFLQRPPAHSAVKIGGRRAYARARRGEELELPPRSVTTHRVDLLDYSWPRLKLEIECEKGFYVRSLARELGRTLGTGGYCMNIRRTAVGPFTIDRARPLDAIEEINPQDLISIDHALEMIAGGGS